MNYYSRLTKNCHTSAPVSQNNAAHEATQQCYYFFLAVSAGALAFATGLVIRPQTVQQKAPGTLAEGFMTRFPNPYRAS
jgi:hypothetical protein